MKLTVYKASAGSGKTYALASEYLRLALANQSVEQSFRSILAATFTNKATEEMKSRIIHFLSKLAVGSSSVASLANQLEAAVGCTPEVLRSRSSKLLGAILHGYSDFSILTIDKFFQRILQAFIREAGLRPGYAVELNSDRLLDEAVAKLMEDAGSNETIKGWLYRLVEDSMNNGRSWDITPALRKLGYEVFKEAYLFFDEEYQAILSNKDALNTYIAQVQELKLGFESRMKGIGARALSYIESNNLTADDFKNKKSGVVGYFYKLEKGEDFMPGKRAMAAVDVPEEWYSKTSARSEEVKAAYHRLNPLLSEALDLWQQQGVQFNTASLLLKNFKLVGLLSDIANNIQQIAGEENLLPISSSVNLLNRLIGDSDTPFIYEKTGTRYRHFMIDEFQDTSQGQWLNFRPLLHNSLASNNFNMVVGDVKQSIYRWRNGDWRILANQLSSDFSIFGINERELSDNWRSSGVVVSYNNELFTRLASMLQATISGEMEKANIPTDKQGAYSSLVATAYGNVRQHTAHKDKLGKGYVNLSILEPTDEKTSTAQVLERLPLLVAELQDRGYQPGDIAILVRRGSEGQQVADTLLSYKQLSGDTAHSYEVISQDSLFLASSPVVQLAIALFKLAINMEDSLSKAFVRMELLRRAKENLTECDMLENLQQSFTEVDEVFIRSLADKPIEDAFEQLIQHFKLNEQVDDLPFLQELHDVVVRFSSDKLSDIASFIAWWDEQGAAKQVLTANDKQNAIKILTIHKSKGLQYKVVVVPFCTWSLVPKADTVLWLSPTVEPFNAMKHLPIGYTGGLAETIFYEDYFSEKTQSYVDNLNLLYVAFTRAEEELYAMVPMPARKQEEGMASLLSTFMASLKCEDGVAELGELKGVRDGLTVEFGEKQVCQSEVPTGTEGLIALNSYPSAPLQSKLRLRYESQGYFDEEDKSMTPRAYGTLMHRVFSSLTTLDDAENAVAMLVDEGLIEDHEKTYFNERLTSALSFKPAQEWFSKGWEVKAEAEFIVPNGGTSGGFINRPDRVIVKDGEAKVIDYKFGSVERPTYRLQVYTYMQGLQKMGYPTVRGYIWYVDLEKVEEVLL